MVAALTLVIHVLGVLWLATRRIGRDFTFNLAGGRFSGPFGTAQTRR